MRGLTAQLWRKRVERAFEQVGEEEIGLGPPQKGMTEPVRGHDPYERTDAVLARILRGGRGSDRVIVARDNISLQRLRRGDGKHAGARADVNDFARPPALENIVEGEQAAARARVMRCAEGLAGVDLDGKQPAPCLSPVVAAVDEEASGRDLAAFSLRQRDPIGGRQRLDLKRANGSACCFGDQLEQGLASRRRLVMGEDLEAVVDALEQSDGDGGGVERRLERFGKTHRRRFRSLDPRLMRHVPRAGFA